eukprot:Nitzschia sp. Nitz4//scaffold269_size25945//20936//21283//NITZ4_008292-RA/size25945-processed-gene-0.7-mRNA-1//1//CDS//3329544976//8023//frame0
MKHLAVYMMLVLGGNATPSKEDVTAALSAVGIEADEARLSTLLTELEGKDLGELMESGKELLAKIGGGGGGGAAAAAAGGEAAAEEEEEKVEEEEEADMGGGMDMFGGGGDDGDY